MDKKSYLLTSLKYETADTITTVELSDIKTGFAYEESLFKYQPEKTDEVTRHKKEPQKTDKATQKKKK